MPPKHKRPALKTDKVPRWLADIIWPASDYSPSVNDEDGLYDATSDETTSDTETPTKRATGERRAPERHPGAADEPGDGQLRLEIG